MLTQEQLALVGELTLTFNDLEYYVDSYLFALLQVPCDSASYAAELVIGELPSIDRKLKLLRKLGAKYLETDPTLENTVHALNRAIREADSVREERNKIVHSTVFRGGENQPSR
ncbi:MAG TPA: hypothetical protein VNH18_19070, partial [Bryobacteraceae bacterium]|nr:hypothetical protein [Bryobacteraceae bacterium]